jgi:hypothetical protein
MIDSKMDNLFWIYCVVWTRGIAMAAATKLGCPLTGYLGAASEEDTEVEVSFFLSKRCNPVG